MGIGGKETLSQRIESAFNEAVASRLSGKEPEKIPLRVTAEYEGHHPFLTFLIQDKFSGTKTTVEIPVGLADPENDVYFAKILRSYRQTDDYQQYSSPEDIGYDAAEVFRRDYTSTVMGI